VLIASSATKEGIIKLIQEFYFTTEVELEEDAFFFRVKLRGETRCDVYVEKRGKRYRFEGKN